MGAFALVLLMFFVKQWMYSPKKQNASSSTLTVGLNSGYPPYEVVTSSGELEGFDIDIAQAIGAQLGKKVVIKDMAFDALIMELQQGKLDLIISGMSITPERLEKLFMIHYQGKPLTHLALVFWDTIPQGFSSLDDLKNYPDAIVCVQARTLQEMVMKQYPSIQLSYLDIPQMVMDLRYKKSLAALTELPVAEGLKAKQPALQIVHIPLPPHLKSLGNGIALDKKQPKLAAQVEHAIKELKENGALEALEKQWFKESTHGA